MLRAVRHGLVSFLPRPHTAVEDVVRVLLVSSAGGSTLPPRLARTLVEEMRARRRIAGPDDVAAGGLTRREIEVLALIADGMSTAAVAVKLNYSERTIKAIIHGVMTRLKLRNRAHVVAHAVRIGAV